MERALFPTNVDRPTGEIPVAIPGPRPAAARAGQARSGSASGGETPLGEALPVVLTRPHPLAGMQALLVGINYAPEPTGIAPYSTGMAEHLARHAAGFTVLTGMPHYPNWTLDPALRWTLRSREKINLGQGAELTLRRTRHYVPRRQNAATRVAYEASFLANAVTTPLQRRPDLVIAVTPSLGGAVAGARLARRFGSRLLVVVQDLMAKAATQSGIRGGDYAARTAAAIERYALNQANRVAIVSEAFRPQLHEYGISDERISLLPNWTHISPTPLSQAQCRRDLNWPMRPFTVVHTGNIGLKQDLGNLVEAARLSQGMPDLHFVVVGGGSQREAVEQAADGLKNLSFVDPLDCDDYPKALAAADLLVVNERPGVGDMSLPSKLTSYLSAGRPVLAAVADDGATAQELRRTGGAAMVIAPGRPKLLVKAALTLLKDQARRARMAAAGQAYAEATLGERAAAARLDDLIEECLNHP